MQVAPADSAPPDSGSAGPREPVRLLDVPYVPQSEALCGGAALAMVLRYWGEPRVRAEDFARLIAPGDPGIRGDSLVAEVRRRGWSAFPIQATRADVQDHLARGRPVIALVDAGSKVAHYVVLLAWANGGVILHDPAVAPFRAEREEDFGRAWSAAGRWALLVLPPLGPDTSAPARDDVTAAPPPPDTTGFDAPAIPDITGRAPVAGCDALVDAGILKARAGAYVEAEGLLSAAASLCPQSAAPVRELAGLKFRAKEYRAASFLAQRALVLEPGDAYTWRLLAGSRYLSGDVRGALDAWNRVSEPRADLTHVVGLRRTRYKAVADQVDLPSGQLLTWAEYRRAERRLAELPSVTSARLELKPIPAGGAQVNVAVVERPLVFDGLVDAGMTAARAAASNEAVLRVSSLFRLGEVWTARWRFQKNRPRLLMALEAPAVTGGPGIWRLEGFAERQSYMAAEVVRERRHRAGLSYEDWATSDVRLEIGGGYDRFEIPEDPEVPGEPGDPQGPLSVHSTFNVEGAVEVRSSSDRLSVRAGAARWGGNDVRPFQSYEALARWGSESFVSGNWIARAGYSLASDFAPLALWPGASTGTGRGALLRAHPLLEGGIVTGKVFGQRLLHAGLERRGWPWEIRPFKIGWALFVDAAKAWRPLVGDEVPWQVDVGAGLRLAGLGGRGELRADFGYGLEDKETAFSVGLETR
jgi:Peptidase_C39 like family